MMVIRMVLIAIYRCTRTRCWVPDSLPAMPRMAPDVLEIRLPFKVSEMVLASLMSHQIAYCAYAHLL